MAYLGTKPANQVIDSTLIADGTVTPSDLSTGKPVWDTSGNLGIGTSSPTNYTNYRNIEVRGVTTDKGGVVTVATSDASVSGLLFTDLNSGLVLQTNTNHPISFRTNGTTARMTIDSSGRVIMPYQPAFMVTGVNGQAGYASGTDFVYSNTRFNIGGHYSTSTGRFTAPISGRYAFYANCMGDGTDARMMTRMTINGTDYHQGSSSSNSTQYQDSKLFVLAQLNAGDYVYVRNVGNKSTYDFGQMENWFCGYLVS
jgi:hypothetical protein